MRNTLTGVRISDRFLGSYFDRLVDCFYKILPIRENGEGTAAIYMRSLQNELIGCKRFIVGLENDSRLLTLTFILQFLIDNPDCSIETVKREVFKAIDICHKLKRRYAKGD